MGVAPAGERADAAAKALRQCGIRAALTPEEPVALAVAVAPPGGGAPPDLADVVLTAEDGDASARAAGELYRTRLAPWVRSLASGRPDVSAPPHLCAHDPGWAVTAARRGRALRSALAALDPDDRLRLRRIDHIGSTAVPDLAAKPFLDFQVTLDRLPHPTTLAAALAPLGWGPAFGARADSPGVHRDMRHDDDTAPDEAFRKRLLVAPDPLCPAILHVRLTGSPFARRAVRFRDRLRADPALRRDYEQLKREAAAAHADDEDFDDYTRGKSGWLAIAYREIDGSAADHDPWPLDR